MFITIDREKIGIIEHIKEICNDHSNHARLRHRRRPDLYRRNPFGYSGIDGFLRTIDILVDGYRLNRQIGQPIYTILACEAGGMVPQLAREAGPFGVSVISGGGFDSLTAKHDLAQEIAKSVRPVRLLHVGDYDRDENGRRRSRSPTPWRPHTSTRRPYAPHADVMSALPSPKPPMRRWRLPIIRQNRRAGRRPRPPRAGRQEPKPRRTQCPLSSSYRRGSTTRSG